MPTTTLQEVLVARLTGRLLALALVMRGITVCQRMSARWYDPTIGRFLSRDPATSSGRLPVPPHRYVHAENNPLVLIDPSGLAARLTWRGSAGGIVVTYTDDQQATLTAWVTMRATPISGGAASTGAAFVAFTPVNRVRLIAFGGLCPGTYDVEFVVYRILWGQKSRPIPPARFKGRVTVF